SIRAPRPSCGNSGASRNRARPARAEWRASLDTHEAVVEAYRRPLTRILLVSLAASTAACAGGNPCAVTTASVTLTAKKPSDDRAVYFVGGDSRGDEGGVVRWAFQQAKNVNARAFFFLGDMEWSFACDGHFRKEQVEYLSPVSFYPVLGNHEVDWFGFVKGKVHGVDRATDA